MAADGDRQAFSLPYGGPFYRLTARLGLRTEANTVRYWWIVMIAWGPIVVGELLRFVLGATWDRTLLDLSLHARLLVTLPLLLASEVLQDQTARSAVTSMYEGKFCDRERLDRILVRAETFRDSWVAELILAVTAIIGGQLVLWRVVGATGVFHGGESDVEFMSFPRVWYAVVALPIVQFVMFRWLWRWLIWSYTLAGISRLPLVVLATHADLAGGLTALARPVTAFSAFIMALSAILAASWATQLIADRTTLQALLPMLTAFLMLSLAVAVGPLLLLSPHLFRARRRTLALYGDFMRRYMLWFHGKWIEPPHVTADALGSPDIQSLADIGHAYQVASKTRVFVFGPRTVFLVWFAGILPMIPVFSSALTVEHVLKRIVTTVLGGFPI